ncbi:MAG: hypothetical protein HY822_22345 [Acidobacteria bacterium]|nr:hypothetical protein [Acidobacteriota bacterium]
MGKINCGRVLLGGIVAGVVINAVEFVMNMYVLAGDWAAVMKSIGKSAEFGAGAIIMFNLIGFAIGIGAVLLYAAIRPRCGAGVQTAIRAGVGVWFFYGLLPSIGFLTMDLFPARLINIGAAYSLAEIVVATVAGAWLYKEA